MARSNLTRDEARARAQLIGQVSTHVVLDLTAATAGDTFTSTTTLRFACTQPGASTFCDLIAPAVREVTLNGRALDPAEAFDGVRVTLPGLAAENELRVVADAAYMHTGEGLHRFTDPVDGETYLYTQFETADAHRVFACFDQPDLKASHEFEVLAPPAWAVISNNAGVPSTQGDATLWRFPVTPPISTYITAFIAGPYHSVHDVHHGAGGEIPLGVYCRASLAQYLDAEEIFEITHQGFDFFERVFGRPYPFAKYDQLFVPEFNAGAMENAGAVTFRDPYVFRSRVTDAAREARAGTILHEMAHMWFGDLVTMRWWDDLWLNESFATYMSTLSLAEATRFTAAWTTFAHLEKTWAARQDQLPTTHPIAADIVDLDAVETNFDGITYGKGAAVLKQLVAWVGRDAFFTGLRAYFDRHAWGNTTLQDLLGTLEVASGRDLTAWSKEWLETAGINTLRAEFSVDAGGVMHDVAIAQEAPDTHPTLRSHRVALGLYDLDGGALVRRDTLELDVVGARTAVPALDGARQPDLLLVNEADLAYAKIRLDERSLATVVESLHLLDDSLARALCTAAAWDMTRDAEMAARDYATLVIHLMASETDIGVLQALLRQVKAALEQYTDPGYRQTGLNAFATACHERLLAAQPGSDHQLAFARSFAASASLPDHLDVVAGLLDGAVNIAGLAIDTDLRWALLHQLAANGRAGETEIDAELTRDDTAAGRQHALAAKAARPDAAAKQAAWASVVERDDMHNAEQSAVVAGFQVPSQTALLEPYAQRYFDALPAVWQDRTSDTARMIVQGLFPFLLVGQRTLELTDAFLADGDPEPGLRRLLLEGRDGVARAMRAQERDRQAGAPQP